MVKRRFTAHFQNYMLGFSEQSISMSMDELRQEFGAPDEVVRNYMDCLTDAQKKQYRLFRWIPLILSLTLLIGLMGVAIGIVRRE